jgi:TPR repeat protein
LMSLGLLASSGAAFADAAADVMACDVLAASPYDTTRPVGVPGVAMADVNADEAIAACKTALLSNPQNLRVMYDLARALNKAGKEPALQFDLDLKASASGSPAMLFNLANSYINGIGTAKDETKGYQLQCDAATKGMAFAMSFCGDNFRFGRIKNNKSDDENKKTGTDWYQKAADAGDVRGTQKLGSAYFYGWSAGVDKSKGNGFFAKGC